MAATQRITVTGTSGQLAQALTRCAPSYLRLTNIGRPDVDITAWHAVRDAVLASRPDVVIHAAAATNVDACERDPALAFAVNALGTRNVANAAALAGATLVYISTNYVFDGSQVTPYHEWDVPSPLSAYGASKLAGEREALAAATRCYIARTAWLYSAGGHNFALTMRRLMAERAEITVVADQYGNPTYASDLAGALFTMLDIAPYGTYHLVNDGIVSWHEWATEIRDIDGADCAVLPIPGSEYKRDAQPPINGGLASLAAGPAGITLPAWRAALRRCFAE